MGENVACDFGSGFGIDEGEVVEKGGANGGGGFELAALIDIKREGQFGVVAGGKVAFDKGGGLFRAEVFESLAQLVQGLASSCRVFAFGEF